MVDEQAFNISKFKIKAIFFKKLFRKYRNEFNFNIFTYNFILAEILRTMKEILIFSPNIKCKANYKIFY